MKITKNSQTYENIKTAFKKEAQLYTLCELYAEQAEREEYIQISQILHEEANNQKTYTKIWLDLFQDTSDTRSNLLSLSSINNDNELYIKFYKDAQAENYNDVASLLFNITKIKQSYGKKYDILLENINKNNIFHKDDDISWVCSNCGYQYVGRNAPLQCPICKHSRGYFHEQLFNYL